jgi:transposase
LARQCASKPTNVPFKRQPVMVMGLRYLIESLATRTTSGMPTRSRRLFSGRSTRCVPVKTDDQLDLQALHRVRSRLVGQRTAVINQIRGFLLEHGTILGRISKRGNRYLRTMIIQGARVILLRPANWAKHSFGPWLTAAANRLHHNVLATALANKLARIAWTVLMQARSYEARVN